MTGVRFLVSGPRSNQPLRIEKRHKAQTVARLGACARYRILYAQPGAPLFRGDICGCNRAAC